MTYTEKAREIPAVETDVAVVGSGPAGFAAAVTAARLGERVILIEQFGTPGGMSTVGMMSHWTGGCDSRLYREILLKSAKANEGSHDVTIYIDPEKLKLLYLQMLDEAGAAFLPYTFACDAIKEDGRVKGVIVENKAGRSAIMARTVIDASGDGDVAWRAGVPFHTGREEDGKMQPMTLMCKVAGVDTERAAFLGSFETTYDTPKGELQTLAKAILPHPAGHVLTYHSTLPGVVTLNMTNVTDVDGTNPADLAKAERVCREQIGPILSFLREYVPGFEKCYLIGAASMMGVRETRHFEGLYTLTAEDILAAREFPDRLVKGAKFNFDVHNLTGAGLDATGMQKHFPQSKGYDVPRGCFIPKGVDGLLLAGRCISGTHLAHANYRVMPICVGMGEGVGALAAFAHKAGSASYTDVDIAAVQAYLFG